MFLKILVAIDGSSSSHRALEHAVDVVRAMRSKLTLLGSVNLYLHFHARVPLLSIPEARD